MSNSNKKEQQSKNLTAAQRLDALEQGLAMVDGSIGKLYNILDRTTRAITLLSKKLEAVKRASGLTNDQVASVLQEIDLGELKDRVDEMVNNNVLKPSESIEIEKSFVVVRELNRDTNEIAEQRTQFPTFNLPETFKTALANKKVGDIVDLGENRNLVEILEIYSVVLPEPPKEEQSSEASAASGASEAAPEASQEASEEPQPETTSA